MAQYLRQKGTEQVYAIVNNQAYYVPYDFAIANNVFPQVQDIPGRVDQRYQIAGNVNDVSKQVTGSGGTGGSPGGGDSAGGKTTIPVVPGATVDTTKSTFDPYTVPTGSNISPDIWNQLTISDRVVIWLANQEKLNQQQDQKLAFSMNQDVMNKVKASAQADPDIQAKYGDALKADQANLQRSLQYIGDEYAQKTSLTATQQEQDRIKLAEQEAEAGRAYSGFREQAKQRLSQEQSGVIESSRRQLQQQLEQAGQSLEKTYGTVGLGQFAPVTAGGETYTPMGGITGNIETQKQSDILAKQQQLYNLEKY